MTCSTEISRPAAAASVHQGAQAVTLMKFVTQFGVGGTERQFVNLGLALEPSRFAVRFGCLRRTGPLVDEIEASGIPVLDYNVWSFRRPAVLLSQLRLVRDIRRQGVGIVHTYGFAANLFAIPAAKLAGVRIVASIRDIGVYLSPNQQRVQRLICRLADRILVNAGAIRDWLVADGLDENRITVIPNGIDLDRFERRARTGDLHREFGFPAGTPLVGVVGRVTPLKGIEDFLHAAATVSARFPNARFLIVGDGFTVRGRTIEPDDLYREQLRRLAADLGLQDRVTFTGFRAQVEQVLPELTVSVQPSLSEGLSNSLLESMAAGLPVVATRVGGTSEAVQDGENGLLVPPRNPEALAEAISRLLAEPDFAQRLGEAARRRITTRYSMNQLVESTSRFYESLFN
jgi:glycosyltransferase involved in cell wall biosynthesis